MKLRRCVNKQWISNCRQMDSEQRREEGFADMRVKCSRVEDDGLCRKEVLGRRLPYLYNDIVLTESLHRHRAHIYTWMGPEKVYNERCINNTSVIVVLGYGFQGLR